MKKILLPIICLLTTFSLAAQDPAEWVLRPGPECGKDAFIWFLEDQVSTIYGPTNTTNYSTGYLPIMEWTWTGVFGRRHALLEFTSLDLIPQGTAISDARLSLYHKPDNADGEHSNEESTGLESRALIQRVTTDWEEDIVTWNTRPNTTTLNQATLQDPVDLTQDYEDIDVTALVQDMINDPDSSFGFLIRMELTGNYRKLIFASSDDENPDLRPQLVITFENNFDIPEPPEVFSISDTTLCIGEEFELATEIIAPLSVTWQDGTMEDTYLVFDNGTYTATVELEDCSTVSDSVMVSFEPCECVVSLPNVFTPNNDDTNDLFRVLPTECLFVDFELRVYNRWGEIVFESTNPLESWDGRVDGDPAPSDAYAYVLNYSFEDGQGEIIRQSDKGSITILR